MTVGWPLIDSDYTFTYKLGRLRRDRILGRDGTEHTQTTLENAGAAGIHP